MRFLIGYVVILIILAFVIIRIHKGKNEKNITLNYPPWFNSIAHLVSNMMMGVVFGAILFGFAIRKEVSSSLLMGFLIPLSFIYVIAIIIKELEGRKRP